jgi:hypothetical protein
MRWAITHRINVPPPIDDEDDRPDDYEYARIHHFGGHHKHSGNLC